jgi:hypothetical protein
LGASRHPARAPHDQRTQSAYIFGAICPELGKGAGPVMPWCDTQAMQAHLAEISTMVEPGSHAVAILDQAGWHMSDRLDIPVNMTLLPLPPRTPELNPVENVWQYMRENWLSSRIFQSYDDIVAHCCHAWNKLIDRPWQIMGIGLRQWAHGSDQRAVVLIASSPAAGLRAICQRNIELMWLTGRLAPDFKTIADFRRDNGPAICAACAQFIVICRDLSLFTRPLAAIDGSTFKGVTRATKKG